MEDARVTGLLLDNKEPKQELVKAAIAHE